MDLRKNQWSACNPSLIGAAVLIRGIDKRATDWICKYYMSYQLLLCTSFEISTAAHGSPCSAAPTPGQADNCYQTCYICSWSDPRVIMSCLFEPLAERSDRSRMQSTVDTPCMGEPMRALDTFERLIWRRSSRPSRVAVLCSITNNDLQGSCLHADVLFCCKNPFVESELDGCRHTVSPRCNYKDQRTDVLF
jgi:hypothetical protein